MANNFGGLQHVIEYIWDNPSLNDDFTNSLVVLGNSYNPQKPDNRADKDDETRKDEDDDKLANPINFRGEIKSFFDKLTNDVNGNAFGGTLPWQSPMALVSTVNHPWPKDFLDDVKTRIWFTYRSGFPIIPRDVNGPSPLSLGSLFRGTLDLSTVNQGFTTDAGWGCMIRTSQSLLANALLNIHVGRDWRYHEGEYDERFDKQFKVVALFADTPSAPFSIQRIVDYGSKNCNKKPGEWFGPSAAAQSIVYLCERSYKTCKLKTYLTGVIGDIYEDEFLKVAQHDKSTEFTPVLILSGIRLGVKNVNQIYWRFLKKLLDLNQSVGIAGGRPSSSHYFFGYQGDYLFYLDPHMPQKALLLDSDTEEHLKLDFIPSVHTAKIRKLHLSEMDPSMLIGLLIKSRQDYEDLRKSIAEFDTTERFLNIYPKRPELLSSSSAGSALLDEGDFIDLGSNDNECAISSDREPEVDEEDTLHELVHDRKFSQPVIINHEDTIILPNSQAQTVHEIAHKDEIEFDKEASIIDQNDTTENFEQIDKKESYVRPESENGIGMFEEIQRDELRTEIRNGGTETSA
ncbi:hypothetical protein FOA43_000348 [Brettanomyces nanus]|uniref:Cysteine protease n=1 Tax=Eeniella nana TaxID=13502 RepID=A0A875S0R9_EENNA|nr:uncharacterized protein FOA43_000348 [Brettanomyces nanus]QPG73044.1 hypothetical protein FOA43_000348 [Brettanomyces nanus]